MRGEKGEIANILLIGIFQ